MGRHTLQRDLETANFTGSGKMLLTPEGYLFGWGAAIPDDGAAGWAPGAIFVDSTGAVVYRNDGSKTSSDFDTIVTA